MMMMMMMMMIIIITFRFWFLEYITVQYETIKNENQIYITPFLQKRF